MILSTKIRIFVEFVFGIGLLYFSVNTNARASYLSLGSNVSMVFLLGSAGFIFLGSIELIYLIFVASKERSLNREFREKQVSKQVCPQCGRVLSRGWPTCPNCGQSLVQKSSREWIGLGSVIIGIVAFFIAGIIVGIFAVYFGRIAARRGDKLGLFGIALGLIGAVFWVLVTLGLLF